MNRQIDWANLEILSSQEINELLLGSPKESSQQNTRLDLFPQTRTRTRTMKMKMNKILIVIQVQDPRIILLMKLIGLMKLKDQFHQKYYLIYLGSLKHALCLSILNKLYSKIISVGNHLVKWIYFPTS